MWEVQHLCGTWENTWHIIDENGVDIFHRFTTELEAQKELDDFLREITEEIAYGERDPEHGYDREEFRIVPVE